MIDTVTVSFPVSPKPEQLKEWVGNPLNFPDGGCLPKYFQNITMANGARLTFKHYPPNQRYRKPWLSIQASLPKVLFGNNHQMITQETELREAMSLVNQFIAGKSWLPELDFGTGILYHLDAAYNHQVGEHVQDYIRALFNLDYLNRKTQPYPHEGVQFKSRVTTTKFYDKRKECLSPSANGILRQETSLRHASYIERRMGLEDPTLLDITIDWLAQVLQNDLKKLHLQNAVITDRSTAQWVLKQIYGWSLGDKLFAHLYDRQSTSKAQMIAEGKGESTIRKYEKLITDAGVSLTLTEDGLQLSPLEIRLGDRTNVAASLSDT